MFINITKCEHSPISDRTGAILRCKDCNSESQITNQISFIIYHVIYYNNPSLNRLYPEFMVQLAVRYHKGETNKYPRRRYIVLGLIKRKKSVDCSIKSNCCTVLFTYKNYLYYQFSTQHCLNCEVFIFKYITLKINKHATTKTFRKTAKFS